MAYPTDPIYKFVKNMDGEVFAVKCEDPPFTKTIPFDEANSDYQEYLEWAKTNTAEAVDGLTWDDIRNTRDGILQSTDWTMTTGASVDQAQWAAYRQSIRDIPQTYSGKTPDEVVWPTQPSTAGPNT
tara:strand:+ start:105 stop:485 length:381 start_codon:yes stop_codon:yes gene_type:complete